MDWDTRTIEGMEQTAREEAQNDCNKKINGKWLAVICYASNGPIDEYFKYLYNEKQITRETAIKLLEVGR